MRSQSIRIAMLTVVFAVCAGISSGQSTSPPTAAHGRRHHRVTRSGNTGLVAIPRESAPPSPPQPGQDQAQRSADQKLLRQQQAQSARDAAVANQVVQTAQQQRDNVQREVRIQDAPGPAQTGIVPPAGPPVAPAQATPASSPPQL